MSGVQKGVEKEGEIIDFSHENMSVAPHDANSGCKTLGYVT